MSRKSQETIGPNVDIPATMEFSAFQHEKLQESFARERWTSILRSSIKLSDVALSEVKESCPAEKRQIT
jgi:hypothetical protein